MALPPAPGPENAPPLRSVHTTNFPGLLAEFGVSLLVSTYQAGKLVLLRADGERLNTHFRDFDKPMGLALDGGRLAVGTRTQVREFCNVPAVCPRLEPAGKHDACFLPRSAHTTGDVQVHEMAFVGGELWFVNTRFSCLCTLEGGHSFVPSWRPPFVSALAPEDRCHLNGLGLVDGRPRLVTALGTTDSAGGWRANKRSGGVLLDVATDETLLAGLSMPHSPRLHQGRTWLLESGTGSLGFADLRAGRYQPVAELPGFTRGLDFAGPIAFVGLSQVRESATFGGLPLTERPGERACGVWAVDTRSGRTLGFVRFEGSVQEVFAVQVLPDLRFPELLTDEEPLVADSFVLPDEALPLVPDTLRSAGPGGAKPNYTPEVLLR